MMDCATNKYMRVSLRRQSEMPACLLCRYINKRNYNMQNEQVMCSKQMQVQI